MNNLIYSSHGRVAPHGREIAFGPCNFCLIRGSQQDRHQKKKEVNKINPLYKFIEILNLIYVVVT